VKQIPAQYQNNAGGRHVNMPFCDDKRGIFLISTAHFCPEKAYYHNYMHFFGNIFCFFTCLLEKTEV